MKTFDPVAESVKDGVAVADGDATGDGAGDVIAATWNVARSTAKIMSTHYTGETVADLTDESSPKAKGWAAIAQVGAKRIVVKRAAFRPKPVAAEIEQKCQKLFHDTYLLWFNGLPRRTNGRSGKQTGLSQTRGIIDYLVRRPWLGITSFP